VQIALKGETRRNRIRYFKYFNKRVLSDDETGKNHTQTSQKTENSITAYISRKSRCI